MYCTVSPKPMYIPDWISTPLCIIFSHIVHILEFLYIYSSYIITHILSFSHIYILYSHLYFCIFHPGISCHRMYFCIISNIKFMKVKILANESIKIQKEWNPFLKNVSKIILNSWISYASELCGVVDRNRQKKCVCASWCLADYSQIL